MKIFFIRHGDTDYRTLDTRGVRGWARSFAPLSPMGRVQIDVIANDYRLQEAEAILSSSYARALESAALLNRKLNKPMYVEYDLHEWLPNKDSLSDLDDVSAQKAYEEFRYYTGFDGYVGKELKPKTPPPPEGRTGRA
ncbi:MAG: histidine phosphatase family protein [Deinococcales bacterium]